jgi:hypothetical protein
MDWLEFIVVAVLSLFFLISGIIIGSYFHPSSREVRGLKTRNEDLSQKLRTQLIKNARLFKKMKRLGK